MIKMKYNIGDRVILDGNIIYEVTGIHEFPGTNDTYYNIEPANIMNESVDSDNLRMSVLGSALPLPMYPDYYLGEMATVDVNNKLNLRIQVNPDPGRIGNPYFKVYNSAKLQAGISKVCRLHFFDKGMEYHTDQYIDWEPNQKELKTIRKLLEEIHSNERTNWQMAKWLWNLEYTDFGLERGDIDDYFAGKFDEKFKDHPSYVPSTIKMPETWVYDPPKGKNKRR